MNSSRIIQAFRHVGFEDLGSFTPSLREAGFTIEYVDVPIDDVASIDPLDADIVIVLGGPVGVYDDASYPFINHEINFLRERLRADRPTLGVCLGAQLMAAALDANVYPGVREIGWAPVDLTAYGERSPLAALNSVSVLHWHSDTFDLPEQCELLASTADCRHQAFRRGSNVMGLQFHPEPFAAKLECWLVGHANELAANDIDPIALRRDAIHHAPALERASHRMLSAWIDRLKS